MVGRVTVGKLMDFKSVSPQFLYQTACVIGSVTLLLLPLPTTHALLMVVSSILGLVNGTAVCAMYVMITEVIEGSVPKTRQGQVTTSISFCSFSSLPHGDQWQVNSITNV